MGGISYAKRAKQWFRAPDGMSTWLANVFSGDPVAVGDGSLTRSYGANGVAYIVSPDGAPANYGYMAPMTVRSVGFGLMPVEATVQVSQRRENGLPIPLQSKLTGTDHYAESPWAPGKPGEKFKQVAQETVVDDAFNIQILTVRVDGVDLGLTGECRTQTPAPFRLVGPGYTIDDPGQPPHDPAVDKDYLTEWYRTHDPSTYFHPLWGGELSGTMTIPPFTGCTTQAGDDLSALMTLSVSGPDNPVSARIGWICTKETGADRGGPLAPGMSAPKLTQAWKAEGSPVEGCYGTKKFAYPDRADD